MVNVFVNYYEDKNTVRNKELREVFIRNVLNEDIDKLYVIVDKDLSFMHAINVWMKNKIIIIKNKSRPTYREYFEYINHFTSQDDINVICNGDIYFNDFEIVKQNISSGVVYALSRWDVLENGTVEHYNHADSQDTWIFKGKVRDIEDCDFSLGVAGCDNSICERLLRAGYNVFNASLSIKTFHLHISKVQNYNADIKTPPPIKTLLPTLIS